MKFPTGGKVRERRKAPNRCDSDTDCTVRMEEDVNASLRFFARKVYPFGLFFAQIREGYIMNNQRNIKRLTLLAMLAAVSYLIVVLVRIPVVLFLNYEPKDVIITIGAFVLGPLAGFILSAVVSFLEMVTISSTGPIGCVMNLLSTCSFVCAAAFIYKRRRTMAGAVTGLVVGSLTMTVVMLLWNWLITPLYMGYPRAAVEALLLPVFLPFNLLKAGLNTAITLIVYKPLVTALRKTGLLESKSGSAKRASKTGVYLFAFALLVTCILLMLVMQGKI